MADDEPRARGYWYDVPALHGPRRTPKNERFERNVGSEGYDRHTGVDVPKDPVYRRPGEEKPAADPFGSEAPQPRKGRSGGQG